MAGNKQQATILDVEWQPRPVGGGRRRHAWTEEELAWYAVERRRQYLASLVGTMLMPILTLILFIAPFLVTSWDLEVRITWWLASLFGVYVSFVWFRSHDRDYGYHPEILSDAHLIRRRLLLKLPDPWQRGSELILD